MKAPTQKQLLANWLKIGKSNPWIKRAVDPVFDENSFYFCKDFREFLAKLRHGNWSLGNAFVLGDLCLINQVNGGDEWLVVKGLGNSFESWTTQGFEKTKFNKLVKRLVNLRRHEGFEKFSEYSDWCDKK